VEDVKRESPLRKPSYKIWTAFLIGRLENEQAHFTVIFYLL